MAKKTTPAIIDVPAANPEQEQALQEGSAISGLVAGLREFFSTATALEQHAKSQLDTAKAMPTPTTLEQDEALVSLTRTVNAEKKTIEAHWGITSTVHNFHRRLTAARDRGVKTLDEAARELNRKHTAYVEAEQARARRAAEEERQRREAIARQEREQEQAKLEAEALAAEANSPDVSDRERLFIDAYVWTESAERAAFQAGYKNPAQAGARLLGMVKIVAAIEAKRAADAIREQARAVQAAPLRVEHVEVKAEIATAGTTTWACEVYDPAAFLAAALDPTMRLRYGIPADAVAPVQTRLNEMARALHEKIDTIPGLRHVKKTSIR